VQSQLFSEAQAGVSGLRFVPDFLGVGEADDLLRLVGALPLTEARYKEFTARRRVAAFGGQFDYEAFELRDAPAIPQAFHPLRDKVATMLDVGPGVFEHMLVAEYRPGTPLGWHRDVPDFESIVGVSLLGTATMKFRRYPHRVGARSNALQLELTPRSLYVIEGDARWNWQHSVMATRELRYSLTLRTRRGSALLAQLR